MGFNATTVLEALNLMLALRLHWKSTIYHSVVLLGCSTAPFTV